MDKNIEHLYQLWCEKATLDVDVAKELKEIAKDESRIEDALYM